MAIADFLDQIEPIVLAAKSQKALDFAFAGKDNEHVVSWDNEPVVMSLTLRNLSEEPKKLV